jgi:hypothetical protein
MRVPANGLEVLVHFLCAEIPSADDLLDFSGNLFSMRDAQNQKHSIPWSSVEHRGHT